MDVMVKMVEMVKMELMVRTARMVRMVKMDVMDERVQRVHVDIQDPLVRWDRLVTEAVTDLMVTMDVMGKMDVMETLVQLAQPDQRVILDVMV